MNNEIKKYKVYISMLDAKSIKSAEGGMSDKYNIFGNFAFYDAITLREIKNIQGKLTYLIDEEYAEELDRCIKANVILDNENTKLQQRIDKAIKYMQIFSDFDSCMINGKSFQKAIDILQGVDKE